MSKIFDRVKQQIESNRKVRLQGGYNCIPWKGLPGLSRVIPGIQKKTYTIVTASTKVGKTQLADYLYVYEPFEFIKKYNPSNIKLKIFYFSLEMSKERKIKSILSYKLFKDHKVIMSPENLDSVFEDNILSEDIKSKIDNYDEYFSEFEKVVTIVDHIKNPFGIFKYMKDYAESNGKYIKKVIPWKDEKTGEIVNKEVNDYYIPNDPNEYVIVITDHIGLLGTENGQTLHQAMSKYSSDYCLHMRDKWYMSIVNIQQQAMDGEKQQFDYKGQSIIDKLRPSQDGLGDNKLTARDCDLMIGLFAPYRYKITDYNNYDITKLGDNYRELIILVNRNGSGFLSDHLLFNGAVNYFEELPKVLSNNDYIDIKNKFK